MILAASDGQAEERLRKTNDPHPPFPADHRSVG